MDLGICPVCKGTGHKPCPDNLRDYGRSHGWYGYRAEDDTVTCDNCGGQTMYGGATGRVRRRADGTPCVHEYTVRNKGTCWNEYTCKHCGFSYDIDSSD